MKTIESNVIAFFNQWLPKEMGNNVNTVINTINLDREDAIMIFEEFINEFDILSGYSSFDIDKYFYPQKSFWNIIMYKKVKKEEKPKITIAHMIEVAKKKEWFDPL
ncbi:MAG: hypothetical protein COW66_14120 [Flavobacteriaceae bacterium CG18_big_fil_WC_8_21_14_2_50_34_36]|nr:DUF1493 family protein [Flavobacteriia bacterium]NCT16780.1 DUF1493 family protein [Flavobacteriia bacterium]PIQ16841.1 MAG: hypothetical protein COW66_14120 [Flavobacteriaceae bacterium CG18_big_fil_WC_8_21_14_2_50_34_36]PIZ07003.1 MAG: hypothetical protein COY56_11200 [Flavobacteriaceae bacterium CG_4_10_14_0_8_um_filter_34_31]PJC06256.1 MAG: hypothetical protein CO068_12075 [Flavobacteriaceae bacterium CG_4_9_14_0_8_um_filter_34_30]